ncbi:hypothetical protein VFPFJ_03322 [Purpureocillium lilacinum]|uniref:Uncharacterized protein n=1 Tax=Purpureocillium lilacinum TaxID=33203 RepID=A0A179HNZ5_PURLI|nr:hypothetical protein VFPFJ_03322 [Purpureocillium lilacinum]OAQ81527.1 hypothetical protein VFPBJ_04111 [Purpureocillium lilacinum]OAQ91582.1 hypothetical protein VFPFJ_03322 [Purpureocillium lilacinum]
MPLRLASWTIVRRVASCVNLCAVPTAMRKSHGTFRSSSHSTDDALDNHVPSGHQPTCAKQVVDHRRTPVCRFSLGSVQSITRDCPRVAW